MGYCDITTGTYSTTITFVNTTTRKQTVSRKVKLAVESDFIGSHVINQVIEVNWGSGIVLKFQNGTGGSRITEITEFPFYAKPFQDGLDEEYIPPFYVPQGYFTYDLDRGEIDIPKEFFQSRVEEFG